MPITISFEVEGEQQLKRRMKMVVYSTVNLDVPLRKIGAEMLKSVESNFDSRGKLFGAKWEPRKDKKPWPLLQKTGAMRAGFKDNYGEGYVEIYNVADYFKYHQSNKPRKKLPRRIMLKIDQVRKVFIIKAFQEHLGKAVTGK